MPEQISPAESASTAPASKVKLVIFLGIGLIVVLALVGIYVALTANTSSPLNENTFVPPPDSTTAVSWTFDGSGWQPSSTPPACPEPLFDLPVQKADVTSILRPGQSRSGDYKSHGGFRFSADTGNQHTITAPADMYLFKASRYLESGYLQYFLVFSMPCGYVFKLDHLAKLSGDLAVLDDILPAPTEGDSRTTPINPAIYVEQGDVIATEVGLGNNVFIDFGLHDVTKENAISQDPVWRAAHPNGEEFIYHGVCWLDYLSQVDREYFLSLPIANVEAKLSDYCVD